MLKAVVLICSFASYLAYLAALSDFHGPRRGNRTRTFSGRQTGETNNHENTTLPKFAQICLRHR